MSKIFNIVETGGTFSIWADSPTPLFLRDPPDYASA